MADEKTPETTTATTPAAETGTAATQATTTPAVATTTTTTTPATPAATQSQGILVAPEQLQELLGYKRKFDEIEAANKVALDAEARKAAIALAKAGEVEKALQTTEERYKGELAAERSQLASERHKNNTEAMNRLITDNLPIDRFPNQYAFADARAKIADALEASRDAAGNITIREKGTFRTVAEVIATKMASAEFAHLLKPSTTGGAGAGGGAAAATDPTRPKTFSDVLLAAHELTNSRGNNSFDPRPGRN
jgi:hypothetical protein